MNKNKFLISLTALLILAGSCNFLKAQHQHPAFWNEIQAFKKQDGIARPPQNAILFVGSSSFNFWKDVNANFPGYNIINRGFGGSSLPDVIRYTEDIIFPYNPKQIVIYCGENDLAASNTVTPDTVLARFKELYQKIRKHSAKVNIAFVSIKPSPSRIHLLAKMRKANALIKNFLSTEKNTAYINVFDKMLDDKGAPLQHIFVNDNLHMNPKGYAIWTPIIKPYLLK